jgi:hypothetical protein
MTKAQLIALLANFPDDTPVYLVAYTDAPGGEYLEPPHPRLSHAYTNVHRQTVPDWTNSKKDLKSHHSVIIL